MVKLSMVFGTPALAFLSLGMLWGHSNLPVSFEPNRGQAAAGVEYVASGDGYSLELRGGRADLRARRAHLATVLVGASANSQPEAERLLPGVATYCKGWRASACISRIPKYGRVRYRGIYRGVDVVYYGNEGRLEFDFVVAPGADPRQIRMRYEGARNMRLDADGSLVIETEGGTLRQHAPEIYQEVNGTRVTVAGHYALRRGIARIELARYDRSRPLIIDPVLTWATYFGSSGIDTGDGVAIGPDGNIYIAGSAPSSTGYAQGFVSILKPGGTEVVKTVTLQGSYDTYAHAIAVDASGNAYAVGETDVTVSAFGTDTDTFFAKISPAGDILDLFAFGGSGTDVAMSVAVDRAGNAFMAGYTDYSRDFIASSPLRFGGGLDAFVAKFDSSGDLVAATYYGGSADDYATAVAVDGNGNVFITGATFSTLFPVGPTAFQQSLAGGNDAFAAKFTNSLALAYSTYLGGAGNETGYGIAVDSAGGAYITGQTTSADFPLVNAYQGSLRGASDIFVTRVRPDATGLTYSTLIGGTGDDTGYGIVLDSGGNANITGATASKDFPVSDSFQNTNRGNTNAIVAALDSSGSALLFSSYLGGNTTNGTNGDYGNAIAASCSTGLVVVGTTTSSDLPGTTGTFGAAYRGGAGDAFVARIGAGGGTPAVASGGVVNGASFAAGPVAPGSLVVIYGTGLAAGTQLAASTPLPVNLLGAGVTINGQTAPFYYASPGQMNVQLPYEVAAGAASVTVTNPCGSSVQASFQVAAVAPYLFQQTNGDAIAYNQDNTLNSAANPAPAGSAITVYLTGIGPVNPAVPTGAAAPSAPGSPLSYATLPGSGTVGGWKADPFFLGLTPSTVGVAQANLIVPSLSAGAYPVVITVGGVASNGPKIYIK